MVQDTVVEIAQRLRNLRGSHYHYEDSDFLDEVIFVAGQPVTNEISKGNNCHYNFIKYSPIAGDLNVGQKHTRD